MFRVLTIAREYGSGGGPIARLVAARLGWQLLDDDILHHIAQTADIDPAVVGRYDECVDSWFHRLTKRTFGRGAFEGLAPVGGSDIFDAESMAQLSRRAIDEAASLGNCVIVGRGGQCILQDRSDAFHVFVYAPIEERIRRVREMFGEQEAHVSNIEANDRMRVAYIRHHYDCDWRDPHLYHALFCSTVGDEIVAEAILCAMGYRQEVAGGGVRGS